MPFFFVIFCFEKCAKMPIFIVFFEKQPKKCPPPKKPKNDNFSHFAKHRLIKKKPLCCNPPFDQKLVFLNLGFLKPKNNDVEQQNITQNQEERKIRKRDFKEKTRQETKKREHIHWKPRNCNFIFSCCSIHETKAKKKEQWKKRHKQETKRKPKKKDKKEERKTRGKERQRKRNRKGGGQKRLREEERETLKINQKNAPFRGKKQGFLLKQRKERNQKENKKQPRKQKNNK